MQAQKEDSDVHPVPERRRHPRAPLNLPARLRWIGALGQTVIVTSTLDVSRGGLLAPLELTRDQAFHLHSPAWVTLPYDSASLALQPETPVRVARFKQTPSGAFLLGFELEVPPGVPGTAPASLPCEQRKHSRSTLAVPVRIHWTGTPWPEESMTINVSDGGVLFCARRLYAPGDGVALSLPGGLLPGLPASGQEIPARIVWRKSLPEYDCVAAEFLTPS